MFAEICINFDLICFQFSAESPIDAKFKKDSFFAVYDGHGTTVVADTLKEHLHKYISKNEHYPTDVQQSIKESKNAV